LGFAIEFLWNNLNTQKAIGQVSTRTYLSEVGKDSHASPNNGIINYSYDGFNRLIGIKDSDGKLIKSYQ
jgi:YD repeat-containing protein